MEAVVGLGAGGSAEVGSAAAASVAADLEAATGSAEAAEMARAAAEAAGGSAEAAEAAVEAAALTAAATRAVPERQTAHEQTLRRKTTRQRARSGRATTNNKVVVEKALDLFPDCIKPRIGRARQTRSDPKPLARMQRSHASARTVRCHGATARHTRVDSGVTGAARRRAAFPAVRGADP